MRDLGKRWLHLRQLAGFQQLIRYARIFKHGDIAGRVFVLLRGTEQLKRTALTPFIFNARRGTQRFQAVAAVFRQPHHAPFVFHIVAGVAVAQHLPHPLKLELRAVEADRQRRMSLKHPFDRLQRNARGRPRRSVARGDLPRIRRTGFQRRTGFAIDNGNLMSRLT